MSLQTKRLTARAVSTISKPGRHADGNGLYLVVGPGSSRRWLFMFRWEGKLKEMGLGGSTAVSLSEARERAHEARRILATGINPIESRRQAEAAKAGDQTFGPFASALVTELSYGFRNEKHRAQWSMTLTTYAAQLADIPLDQVSTENVLSVLAPIWRVKNETASRLRGRIERVLDAAKARGLRSGENPARWRGHLELLLPKRQKLQRGHHAAMPFMTVPDLIAQLQKRKALAALALELTILTAARSGEILNATWDEFDLQAANWTVPSIRMKAGRLHRVPLAKRSIEILRILQTVRVGIFVFPGQKTGRPLSNMAMEMAMRRMNCGQFTVHGFRSSFRDWVGEATNFPRELAEEALAHVVGDQTERAYRRGDALEKRRNLMEEWAKFCRSELSKLPPEPNEEHRLLVPVTAGRLVNEL